MPNKIFIYNGPGANESCLSDTKELFARYDVVEKPDIATLDFKSNFAGLDFSKDNVTVVIPGGNAYEFHTTSTLDTKANIRAMLASGSNYVGICAGAFLALDHFLFSESHGITPENGKLNFITPKSYPTVKFVNFNLSNSWQAAGPFYPDAEYYLKRYINHDKAVSAATLRRADIFKPYVVKLKYSSASINAASIYIRGCGFMQVGNHSDLDVLATYPNPLDLDFERPYVPNPYYLNAGPIYTKKTLTDMPAILSRPKTDEKGGVFLSGLHIEAAVEGSKIFGFYAEQKDKEAIPLTDEALKTLSDDRKVSLEQNVAALKKALK